MGEGKISVGTAVTGMALAAAGAWGVSAIQEDPVSPPAVYTQTVPTEEVEQVTQPVEIVPTKANQAATTRRAEATIYSGYSGGDRDCGDFSTHIDAQSFYESQGPGDPHDLDRDSDGSACESLP